jgi:excisionase family DNA binding protein
VTRTVVVTEEELRAIFREEARKAFLELTGNDNVSTAEAAEILQVAPRTVVNYAKRGHLRSQGVGRSLRFKRSDVVELKARGVHGV